MTDAHLTRRTASQDAPGLEPGAAAIDLTDLATARTICPEEVDRVLASAADLYVSGRRITERALTAATGLEPDTVATCLGDLVGRRVLRPSGASPHHYLFVPGRWPAR